MHIKVSLTCELVWKVIYSHKAFKLESRNFFKKLIRAVIVLLGYSNKQTIKILLLWRLNTRYPLY